MPTQRPTVRKTATTIAEATAPARSRRARVRTAALFLGAVGLVAACTSAPTLTTPVATKQAAGTAAVTPGGGSVSTPTPDTVALTPNVSAGTPVAVDTVVSVKATDGTVTEVKLSYQDAKTGPQTVEGAISADASTWTAGSLLEPNTTYTLDMTGESADGSQKTSQATFSTQNLAAKQQISATIIQNGATVGVAMPVIVRFDVPVSDKAAFEKKMTVTSVPAQPGAWAWYGNSEIHWRPVTYWQPGTKVTVKADINSVPAGKGAYGKASVTGGFTVGSSLTMKADLKTHQLAVTINGKLARTIPITGGKPGFESRSGTKVIVEKLAKTVMNSETIGIKAGAPDSYKLDVQWAMRETWSGEFLHAAPWSVGSQGRANVSHGCIGMSTGNAAWLFSQVKVGDPVVVSGTAKPIERGNGYTDWNISFEEFKKFSALTGTN